MRLWGAFDDDVGKLGGSHSGRSTSPVHSPVHSSNCSVKKVSERVGSLVGETGGTLVDSFNSWGN
jgi:hypothetical protein